jgi:hypothetical protein
VLFDNFEFENEAAARKKSGYDEFLNELPSDCITDNEKRVILIGTGSRT